MSLVFDHTSRAQRVLFGTDRAAVHLVDAVAGLDAERLLLIAAPSSAGVAGELTAQLPIVAVFDDVAQHVPAVKARAAVELAEAQRADAIIALGGGSAIGFAKIVARELGLPVIAVPTTFAGSEATDVWGITEGGQKVTGVDARVLPQVIVYDARLSATLPATLAMASGLNAVAHAVDALWAPRVDPINAALGAEGLRALVPGLRGLSQRHGDLEARERTLYGAYLAALAFASAGSGIHHKICHVLGGAFGLSHAEMHSIVLPYVVEFQAPSVPVAVARVSEALDGAPAAGGLRELRRQLGVVGSLAELGLREADIAPAAELAFKAVPASNPREFTVADIEEIIRKAWAGEAVKG